MEKYLKIGDYFGGNLSVSSGIRERIVSAKGEVLATTPSQQVAKFAAHAINSHDELVEMNKELLAALEEAKSVLSSINASWQHKVEVEDDDDPAFWQRNDWVKWAKGEVLPTVETAIAKAKATS